MKENINSQDTTAARSNSPISIDGGASVKGRWNIAVKDKYGNVTYEDVIENIVVNEGLDELLSATLAGGAQTTTWYVGLTDGTPTTAAGDTLSSHSGWAEVTGYDEAARPTWTAGSVSGQSVDNSGSVASVTISNNSTTVGGAFLASDSTKGGTAGTLYAVGAFSGGDVTLSSGSTLEVTATFTTSSS